MSAVATHWLIFYMLLSSVHYHSKLNYKSPPPPVSPHHKLSLSCGAVLCRATPRGARSSLRWDNSAWNVPAFFSLTYAAAAVAVFIRAAEKRKKKFVFMHIHFKIWTSRQFPSRIGLRVAVGHQKSRPVITKSLMSGFELDESRDRPLKRRNV